MRPALEISWTDEERRKLILWHRLGERVLKVKLNSVLVLHSTGPAVFLFCCQEVKS